MTLSLSCRCLKIGALGNAGRVRDWRELWNPLPEYVFDKLPVLESQQVAQRETT